MTYAFTFDASACSGCKACQVACKDKNNLPAGVLWRRVYEVSGGNWINVGARSSRTDVKTHPGVGGPNPYPVWENTVFAYNLSVACNHCVHPKCAGVCPTDAYVQREDGVVYIDESKCMGCGYCAWACPYNAPRYNPDARHMTKCNFCYDNLDAGLPPACVAACPMRVLELVEIGEQEEESRSQWSVTGKSLWMLPGDEHPFPLPERSRTEPHLSVQPHTGMENELEKTISNWEEINTGKAKSEVPLVAFTLLTQMATGMAVLAFFSGPLSLQFLITLGGLIGFGGLISILHLGTPLNAWRAIFHLKKSWLSREILMFGLFGASWVVALLMPGMGKLPLAIFGIGLVYSMAQVYRLRSIQAWDTNRTPLAFSTSAILLGGLGLVFLNLLANDTLKSGYLFVGGAGLAVALLLSLSRGESAHETASRLRSGLIVLGLIGLTIVALVPEVVGRWWTASIFIIALTEEAIGRWLFYEHLHRRSL